jgi:prophage antirepressor-like protein
MPDIVPFYFPTSYGQNEELSVFVKNGEPLFRAEHACRLLDLSNVSRALDRIDDEDKVSLDITTSKLPGQSAIFKWFVTESGLYNLIFASRTSAAKGFKAWITKEVLPSIRKTGGYGVAALPQTYAEALRAHADAVEANERLVSKNQQLALESAEHQSAREEAMLETDQALRHGALHSGKHPVSAIARHLKVTRDIDITPEQINDELVRLGLQMKVATTDFSVKCKFVPTDNGRPLCDWETAIRSGVTIKFLRWDVCSLTEWLLGDE